MYYIHLELYDKLISKVGCAACIPRNIAFLDHRMQEGIYMLFFLLVSHFESKLPVPDCCGE
jgi:hypothetical protein